MAGVGAHFQVAEVVVGAEAEAVVEVTDISKDKAAKTSEELKAEGK